MPVANFKCVREVSSEDCNFSADNLLKLESGKKWKTKSAGEKSAYVIFELNNSSQINGIDIGNEHSAFVEVLVSDSGCRAENFTEILITCSFMTPIESKNSANPNRVRCFSRDALVASAACKSWRLVKVICTQPFNRHVQYGLSFIKLHIADSEPREETSSKVLVPEKLLIRKSSTETKVEGPQDNNTSKPKLFAKFALREDSPDSESESATALFTRWKVTRNTENQPTAAAAIRQASTTSGLQKLTQSVKRTIPISHKTSDLEGSESKMRDRNRDDLLFGDEYKEDQRTNEKLERLSKHIEADKTRLKIQAEELAKKKEKKEEKPTQPLKPTLKLENDSKVGNSPKKLAPKKEKETPAKVSKSEHPSRKRMSSPSQKAAKKMKPLPVLEYRPFNELLRGIVLVISGIQNPDRANLRSKALAMGAKYKGDWEPGCTHLICAFKNTPKYNQVKGRGKIVSRSWIEKCYDLKKYLPWRRYALDGEEQSKSESDNEILDEVLKPATNNDPNEGQETSVKHANEDSSCLNVEQKSFLIESGSDTDDEIQRVLQKNNESTKNLGYRDVFDLTTEEEDFSEL